MPSYALHRDFLLEELARKRGREFVENNKAMLLKSLRYLEQEGRLLSDEDFERTRERGEPLTVS